MLDRFKSWIPCCAVRNGVGKEYGFHRSGAIEVHAGTRGYGENEGRSWIALRDGFGLCKLADSSSAVSAVPASPQGRPICCTRRPSYFAPSSATTWVRSRSRPPAARPSKRRSPPWRGRAARAMVIVTDFQGRPAGILTAPDVVRRVVLRTAAHQAVETVMTSPVVTVTVDDHLFQAITTMRRHGLRDVPVVDGPAGSSVTWRSTKRCSSCPLCPCGLHGCRSADAG